MILPGEDVRAMSPTAAPWSLLSTVTKATLCRLVAVAPVHCWGPLSAVVRALWPGFGRV